MPSKPCLCDSGPPAPKPVTVVRMMSGLTARRLTRSSAQRPQHAGRQIGDDDISGGDQLSDDFAALGCRRVEGHAELVAVHCQEHRADIAGGTGSDRDIAAILAAADPLDADDFGAEVAEQGRADRGRRYSGRNRERECRRARRARNPPRCPPRSGKTQHTRPASGWHFFLKVGEGSARRAAGRRAEPALARQYPVWSDVKPRPERAHCPDPRPGGTACRRQGEGALFGRQTSSEPRRRFR